MKQVLPLSEYHSLKSTNTNSFAILSSYFTESIFSLWRQTENAKYLGYAEAIRRSLVRRQTPSGGIANVKDVTTEEFSEKIDFQEPMLLSGTLKYLFLTYADPTVLSLDQYVFNELGHPLPICGRHPVYPAELCSYNSKISWMVLYQYLSQHMTKLLIWSMLLNICSVKEMSRNPSTRLQIDVN